MTRKATVAQTIISLVLLISIFTTAGCDSSSTADSSSAETPPRIESVTQQTLTFSIQVTDANGQPVKGAVLKPWALRSSLGHGSWRAKPTGDPGPKETTTNAEGIAAVVYPKYHSVEEQVVVTAVTVSINHPDHPHVSHEDVTVPATSTDPHVASLPRGAAVEVSVTLNGEPVIDKNIRASWTGMRNFYGGTDIAIRDDGTVRIPPLTEGLGQLMLIRIDGKKASHFSSIQIFDVAASPEPIQMDVEMLPALPIRGRLSDNVPRPIRNGRVKLSTIGDGNSVDTVEWFDWAPIAADGTFVINGWPQNEPAQLIALCDGFIARNGEAPAMVPPERAKGGYLRAQVFLEPQASEILVEMTPMVRCRFECKNAFDKPLQNINVGSGPNIGWWNSGSQIYCSPLVDPIDFWLNGKYEPSAAAKEIPEPFSGTTDSMGIVEFDLPAGHARIYAGNERFQMAARDGRRHRKIYVGREKAVVEQLVLQPKGLDCLGDWEDLCGLVFG